MSVIVPPMQSFDDVRNVMANLFSQIQVSMLNPVSNMRGNRVSNVATPSDVNDAVTLGYLNSALSQLTTNTATSAQTVQGYSPIVLFASVAPSSSLGSSYANISGASVTLNNLGTWIFMGRTSYALNGTGDSNQPFRTQLTINSTPTGQNVFVEGWVGTYTTVVGTVTSTVTGVDRMTSLGIWTYVLGSLGIPAQLQAKKDGGNGSSVVEQADLLAILLPNLQLTL